MTIASYSLPVDIPWQRIAFSTDMIDPVACDRALPPRWRSSLAVFKYEPPEDQQRTDGFSITYLKVACTITGFQVDGKEIRIRERLSRSGWTTGDMTSRLGDLASAYYPCHGAMLEVVVAPPEGGDPVQLADYPYFADFDPKKRELYEVVTDTGEVMSRSLEDVNVRHGQTTLQSHEVRDMTTLGASITGGGGGASATGSISNTSGTTDLSQQGAENVRTSDAARENRETFSHTTQLSQMYHQLDSYHLGTNRAAFFVLPRPHTIQSPTTFVNGPREIEGVQEFMLVVVRPKAMEHFCVEAYLETAHLSGKPIADWGQTETPLPLHIETPDTTRHFGSNTSTRLAGYVVDLDRGGYALGELPHGAPKGYRVGPVNITMNGDYTFFADAETITVSGYAEGLRAGDDVYGSTLDLNATVFLKKKIPDVSGHEPGLLITARAVCSCPRPLLSRPADTPSVVYERALAPEGGYSAISGTTAMSSREANRLGAQIKREMLSSLSSADRYPRGAVDLLDSQLVADLLGTHIRHADADQNRRVADSPKVDPLVARKIVAYHPSATRSELLEMPLGQQVERFGLSFDEAVALRRALVDLPEPNGPPPVPERASVEVPLLTGLSAPEARMVLARAGLALGAQTVQDSPLTSNTVTGQQPPAGSRAEAGGEVAIVLASGFSVRLPEVVGLRLTEAACRIRSSGLASEPSVEGELGPTSRVVALEPPSGTLVTPNALVTITLQRSRRTDTPA